MNKNIASRLFCLLLTGLTLSQNQAQTPGSLDAQFGTAGVVQVAFQNYYSECRSLALQSDGKIILGGTYLSGGKVSMAFSRLNANGTPDNTFGTSGTAAVALNSANGALSTTRVLTNGKIIAAGSLDNLPLVVRLNANGTLDNTFGTSGKVAFNGNMTAILDLVVLPTGKMVGCGIADPGTGKVFAAFRLNADGTADNTFGASGFAYANVGQQPTLTKMAVQSDGKILLTGTVYNASTLYDLILFRFTTAGIADNTFGTGGKVTTVLSTNQAYEQGNAVAVQFDGKIVVAARITNAGPTVFAIVRYSAAGVLDNTFGTNGSTTVNFNNSVDEPKAIAVQSDGKIVVVGATLNGTAREFAIARLTKTGQLDNTFDGDGKVTTAIGTKAYGEGLALQTDGKILVSGYATVNNLSLFAATRYNVGTIVGTQDLENGPQSLQVFPNPIAAGSSFTLQFELKQAQGCQIQLFGSDGRLLRTYPAAQLPAGQQTLSLDLPADLPSGPGLLRVETTAGANTIQVYYSK